MSDESSDEHSMRLTRSGMSSLPVGRLAAHLNRRKESLMFWGYLCILLWWAQPPITPAAPYNTP
jgi:hypothetical protein